MELNPSDSPKVKILRVNAPEKRPLRIENVRRMMRHVVHPVALITSTDILISAEGAPISWKGATVSSFNTVTLSPLPIVSFNIKKLSSTYEAIKNSGLFRAHLLDSTKISARIAGKFSGGNKSSPFHDESGSLESFALPISRVNLLSERRPGREPPHINNYPRFRFSLRCQYVPQKTVEIEDHVVVFGEVTETEAHFHRLKESSVLMYYVDGKYCPPISRTVSGCFSSSSDLRPSEENNDVDGVE
ncbi:hypothetical protein H2200_001412 [Cladophialophora chaetospira]|uniref:Flavin reductase like domain-containing protein n=1 Tax=Cladophialophora chaetospira TaxID=386627 RepID=A0AA39CPK5_9EURO|nr:hypothetical protein H2200_001412 [Cladophialophora chaetospira]